MRSNRHETLVISLLLLLTTLPSFFSSHIGILIQLAATGPILFIIVKKENYRLFVQETIFPFILLFIYIILVSSVSGNPTNILRAILFSGMPIVLFLALSSSIRLVSVIQSIISVSVLITVVEIIGNPLLDKGSVVVLPMQIGIEPLGFFFVGNPNAYGILSALGLIASAAFWIYNKSFRYVWFSLACGIGLFFSFSRGALVVATAGLFTVAVIYLYGRKFAWWAATLTIFGGILLTSLGFYSKLIPIDFSRRSILWRSSLSAIQDKPLFGYGYVDTALVVSQYTTKGFEQLSPHHFAFQILITSGIIGFLLYMFIYLQAFQLSIRSEMKEHTVAGGAGVLTGVFSAGFFGSITIFGINTIPMLFALIIVSISSEIL